MQWAQDQQHVFPPRRCRRSWESSPRKFRRLRDHSDQGWDSWPESWELSGPFRGCGRGWGHTSRQRAGWSRATDCDPCTMACSSALGECHPPRVLCDGLADSDHTSRNCNIRAVSGAQCRCWIQVVSYLAPSRTKQIGCFLDIHDRYSFVASLRKKIITLCCLHVWHTIETPDVVCEFTSRTLCY